MSETLQLEQLTGFLQQLLGESLFAIYLYGSAVAVVAEMSVLEL